MTRLGQRRLVAGALTLVVLAVLGLLYLQTLALATATRDAWMLTRDLVAGSLLEGDTVRLVHIPTAPDRLDLLQASPLHRRLAHRAGARTLLSPEDLLGPETVQVPLSLRSAPSLGSGDTIDVYAVVQGRTMLVGRRLVVAGGGSPLVVLVPAADEPYWIALQANDVALFAARSSGIGVPDTQGVSVGDAVAGLGGAALSGSGGGPPAAGSSSPPAGPPTGPAPPPSGPA